MDVSKIKKTGGLGVKKMILPWICFACTGLLFTITFNALWWVITPLVTALVLYYLGQGLYGIQKSNFRAAFRSSLLGFSLILGAWQGYWIFEAHSQTYWNLGKRREYFHVNAKSLAAGRSDAGVLSFDGDSRVDNRFVTAYRSAGVTFCMAPVTTDEPVISEPIQYWVVGSNCCRAHKFDCDQSADDNFHTAIVMRRRTNFFQSWSNDDDIMYDMAENISLTTYGLQRAEGSMRVRWLDKQTAKSTFIAEMWISWLKAFVISIPFWWFCGMLSTLVPKSRTTIAFDPTPQ